MWGYHKYIIEVDCCISPTYLICQLGWLLHLANTSQMPPHCLLDYSSPCVNLCLSNIVPDMAYALLKLLKVDKMLSWSSHTSYSFPPFHTSQHANDSSECTDNRVNHLGLLFTLFLPFLLFIIPLVPKLLYRSTRIVSLSVSERLYNIDGGI
jgi:hypothetical protein